MLITYTKVSKLTFPIYVLPEGVWEEYDGLRMLNGLLVDDTNMPGATLGVRRLQNSGRELMPLRKAVFNHVGLIKQSSNRRFIDSKGQLFYYKKTRLVQLRYLRIKSLEPKDGKGTVMRVHGVRAPYVLIRPPTEGRKWAGILHLGEVPWLVYEFSQTKKPMCRKRV